MRDTQNVPRETPEDLNSRPGCEPTLLNGCVYAGLALVASAIIVIGVTSRFQETMEKVNRAFSKRPAVVAPESQPHYNSPQTQPDYK
ncbi:MAG: hypothetical protein KKF56_00505 [Nanoarchaeota archaeon]|nr:hypothetical protein [Nanoarchaeota archaeon]